MAEEEKVGFHKALVNKIVAIAKAVVNGICALLAKIGLISEDTKTKVTSTSESIYAKAIQAAELIDEVNTKLKTVLESADIDKADAEELKTLLSNKDYAGVLKKVGELVKGLKESDAKTQLKEIKEKVETIIALLKK